MLRVLTISSMFPDTANPRSGIFVCREAQYLSEYDIKCDFLVPRPFAPWPLYLSKKWKCYGPKNKLACPKDLVARQSRYFRLPGEWFCWLEGYSLILGSIATARKWHKEQPFDVVWGIGMFPAGFAATRIGAALNLPVATLAAGSDVMIYSEKSPRLRKQLEAILVKADLPVGVCEMICKRMSNTGQCRREPLCVYLGRDTEKFKPAANKKELRKKLGFNENDVIGVYTGYVSAGKGMLELAEILPELLLKYPNFKFVCVGSGPEENSLRQAAQKVNRTDNIIFTGLVSPDEVPKYLQIADFMIFPSHSEGMPQAVLEAMNCGLAVVATKVGGIPEAVIDKQTGLLVDVKKPEQLKQAIVRMINDSEFRVTSGRNSLEYSHLVFDPRKNAQKLAEALNNLKN